MGNRKEIINIIRRRGGKEVKMTIGIEGEGGPSPEEMGTDESGRIESPEVAQVMAEAEKKTQEKLAFARELGLSQESLSELGIERDAVAEKSRAEYEQAMVLAESGLVSLLKNPDFPVRVELPQRFFGSNLEPYFEAAVKYRTTKIDDRGKQVPRNFNGKQINLKQTKELDYFLSLDPIGKR